ncbi:MAG TPA: TatD family deoxyribonuclease [Candidatus Altiarchaeales archaeon]|nr:TatD family deoxyribonuclease [Candidatus Altiarchaeales archaeon]
MLFDCHTHLHFKQFDSDRSEILKKILEKDVSIINSTVEPNEVEAGFQLSKNKNVYWTLGLSASTLDEKQVEETISLIRKHEKDIVGIGEVGVDYYWVKEKEERKKLGEHFERFIGLSRELDLPLIVHSRDAEQKCMDILEKNGKTAMMHCFSGTVRQAEILAERGSIISIPTNLVYSKRKQDVAGAVPLESIVLETDSPYLPPKPGERNNPLNIKESLEILAKIKKESVDDVARQTAENAKKFFRIG